MRPIKRTNSSLQICEHCNGVGSFWLYDPHIEESKAEDCTLCQGSGITLVTITKVTEYISESDIKKMRERKQANQYPDGH